MGVIPQNKMVGNVSEKLYAVEEILKYPSHGSTGFLFINWDRETNKQIFFGYHDEGFFYEVNRTGKVFLADPTVTPKKLATLIRQVIKEQGLYEGLYERLLWRTGREEGYPHLKKLFETAQARYDFKLLYELSQLVGRISGKEHEPNYGEEVETEEWWRQEKSKYPLVFQKIIEIFGRYYLEEDAFIFKFRVGGIRRAVAFEYLDPNMKYEFHVFPFINAEPIESGIIPAPNGTAEEYAQGMVEILERLGYYKSVLQYYMNKVFSSFRDHIRKAINQAGLPLLKELSLLFGHDQTEVL